MAMSMKDVRSRLSSYREKKAKQHQEKETTSVPNEDERSHSSETERSGDAAASSMEHQHGPTENACSVDTQDQQQQEKTLEHSPSSPWFARALKVFLWLVLWGFFIEIEFGVVYFVVSILFFLFHSLRGSRRKPSEPSAYSVFNENCEAIDGTLTAEQFERELRGGPSAVRS